VREPGSYRALSRLERISGFSDHGKFSLIHSGGSEQDPDVVVIGAGPNVALAACVPREEGCGCGGRSEPRPSGGVSAPKNYRLRSSRVGAAFFSRRQYQPAFFASRPDLEVRVGSRAIRDFVPGSRRSFRVLPGISTRRGAFGFREKERPAMRGVKSPAGIAAVEERSYSSSFSSLAGALAPMLASSFAMLKLAPCSRASDAGSLRGISRRRPRDAGSPGLALHCRRGAGRALRRRARLHARRRRATRRLSGSVGGAQRITNAGCASWSPRGTLASRVRGDAGLVSSGAPEAAARRRRTRSRARACWPHGAPFAPARLDRARDIGRRGSSQD